MMILFFEAAVTAFDMYVITTFLYRRLMKRVPIQAVILASVFCATCQYAIFHYNLPVYINILSSATFCFILSLMFNASWPQRLLYPLVITSLEIISEITAGILLSGLSGLTASEIVAASDNMLFQTGHVISKLIFFIFIRILYRLHVMNDSMLPPRQWLMIMAVPVTSLAVSFGLAFSAESYIINNPIAPLLILAGMLGINALSFLMYDELSLQSKNIVEHERAKNRMELDLRRYETMIAQSKEFAALLHDTRKHHDTVYDLLISGDLSAALSYMEALCASGSAYPSENATMPNAAALMVLRRKTDEAIQNGIEVITNYEVAPVLPIDEISLCLILGNALDNAIEACRHLAKGEKKLIEIDMRYENSRLTIRIVNTSKPVKIRNNTCVTTKNNSLVHGYGLPNILKTVTEKGGNSVIRYENGMFILSLIFLL